MANRRSYDDACGIARGLDILGERWAGLVVRELLLGPRRYSDLAKALPGISTNILATRLTELAHQEIVRRRRLPPPAGSHVYELTDWGRRLEPVLLSLGEWAAQSPIPAPAGRVGSTSFLLGLRSNFNDEAGEFAGTIQLALVDGVYELSAKDGVLHITPGGDGKADARVEGDIRSLLTVIYGDHSLLEAVEAGELSVQGDHASVARFLDQFRTPAFLTDQKRL